MIRLLRPLRSAVWSGTSVIQTSFKRIIVLSRKCGTFLSKMVGFLDKNRTICKLSFIFPIQLRKPVLNFRLRLCIICIYSKQRVVSEWLKWRTKIESLVFPDLWQDEITVEIMPVCFFSLLSNSLHRVRAHKYGQNKLKEGLPPLKKTNLQNESTTNRQVYTSYNRCVWHSVGEIIQFKEYFLENVIGNLWNI